MRTDAIVVGAELEALVAGVRLVERGMSVRLLATGAGSLHYAPGGLQLLGFAPDDPATMVRDPFDAVRALHPRHPLRLVGDDRIRSALDWFFGFMERSGSPWCNGRGNALAVAMAGVTPVLAHVPAQAMLDGLARKRVAVVMLDGHRDFVGDLAVAHLRRREVDARPLRVDPPPGPTATVSLAAALDRPELAMRFFRQVLDRLPPGADAVLFPAVLGMREHEAACRAADRILGMPALEVPTLPPCLPGMRLYRALTERLETGGALLHIGCRRLRAEIAGRRCLAIRDDDGRRYEAGVFVAGTGGVLMGGLEVDSRGRVSEPIFGLPVHQTEPLARRPQDLVLDALHSTGVEVDACLRPPMVGSVAGGDAIENLFVAGSTLAHWNPCREASGEGVAVATGWTAAEHAVCARG